MVDLLHVVAFSDTVKLDIEHHTATAISALKPVDSGKQRL
jgi:uncharacterized protein (AIM24 family)